MLGEFVHRLFIDLMHIERRTEPFWRPYANAALVMACLQQHLVEFGSILKLAGHQLQTVMQHPALG